MAGKMLPIGAKYFEADDDELVVDKDEESKQPSWRGDPECNHSDWTIVVNEENTYHVHKVFLASGLRSCKYFTTLFQTTVRVSELQENTSRITLPKDQAEAFPIMLDFVYSSTESDLGVNTDNAATLRSLARYFGCGALMKSVNKFIHLDLTTETAAKYLHNAFLCNDENLEVSARKLIVENYDDVPTGPLTRLPYDLFRSIICSPDLDKDQHSFASGDIHEYFKANPDALDARSLNELTNHLSEVNEVHAEGLMKLTAELVPHEQDETSLVALDKLCKLCAEGMAYDWRNIDTQQSMQDFFNPVVEGDYRGSGRVAISRLAAALEQAKKDYRGRKRGRAL